MCTRVGLKGLAGGAAPTARHPLYDLYHLAVLILNDVSYIDEALIAAVRPLVGVNFGAVLA
jgi:hypothetical protein